MSKKSDRTEAEQTTGEGRAAAAAKILKGGVKTNVRAGYPSVRPVCRTCGLVNQV